MTTPTVPDYLATLTHLITGAHDNHATTDYHDHAAERRATHARGDDDTDSDLDWRAGRAAG